MHYSAGILVYRLKRIPEVLLGHPGGPFWRNKHDGAWSIPKGEIDFQEDPLAAAKREFFEETGLVVDGEFIPLNLIQMKSGKIVYAWTLDANPDLSFFKSNTFELKWPPKSDKVEKFPELDRLEWFSLEEAKIKIIPAQLPFIERLEQIIPVK